MAEATRTRRSSSGGGRAAAKSPTRHPKPSCTAPDTSAMREPAGKNSPGTPESVRSEIWKSFLRDARMLNAAATWKQRSPRQARLRSIDRR